MDWSMIKMLVSLGAAVVRLVVGIALILRAWEEFRAEKNTDGFILVGIGLVLLSQPVG